MGRSPVKNFLNRDCLYHKNVNPVSLLFLLSQFWGPDKDVNRLDQSMFDDMNRYCWIQQQNNGQQPVGSISNSVTDTDGQVRDQSFNQLTFAILTLLDPICRSTPSRCSTALRSHGSSGRTPPQRSHLLRRPTSISTPYSEASRATSRPSASPMMTVASAPIITPRKILSSNC